MSKDFYLSTGLPVYFGNVEREDFAAYGSPSFREVLEVSPIASGAELCDSRMTDVRRPIRCVMLNQTNDSIDSTGQRRMLTEMGTVGRSRYIVFQDEWYLIVNNPDDQGWYEKSVLWKCDRILKFKSPLTGEVVGYPVYMTNSTKYSSGEQENSMMTLKSNQHSILIPDNEETALLGNGHRFIIGRAKGVPSLWRITQVDDISYQYDGVGLIQFVVAGDVYNPAVDDAENGVADMWTSEERPGSNGKPEAPEDDTVDWWG